MNELIKAIQDAVKGVYSAVNAAVESLPSVQQFEANAELSYGLRMIKGCGTNLIEQVRQLESHLTGKVTEAIATAERSAVEAAIAKGDMLRKADHEAAVNAAVEGAKKATEADITAKFEAKIAAANKRAALKDIPTVVAEKLTDDMLATADLAATAAAIKGRLEKLAKIGVTAENSAAFVAEAATLPFTPEGEAAFASKIASMEVSFQASRKSGGKIETPPNPAAGASAAPAAEDEDRLL